MKTLRPSMLQCIQTVRDLADSVRTNEHEKYALLEVAQAAVWWHEQELGPLVPVMRRRRSRRRFSTRKFDHLFETPQRDQSKP